MVNSLVAYVTESPDQHVFGTQFRKAIFLVAFLVGFPLLLSKPSFSSRYLFLL